MKQVYKNLLSLLIGSSAVLSLNAQIPMAWSQRYNAPPDNSDESRSIAVDGSGNSYVTGSAFNSNGNLDVVTIKYSPQGVPLWINNYDGGVFDNDEGQTIVVDAAGNSYVTGYSRSSGSAQDIVTIKYDTGGNQLWATTYNGSGNGWDQGRSIGIDNSGNVYVTGFESTNNNFTFDMITLKYNSTGVQQWAVVYNGTGNGSDEGSELAVDKVSGSVFVVGYTEISNSPLNNNMVTIKYNTQGQQQWLQTYNGPSNDNDYGKAIALDKFGNIIVTGYSFEANNWFDIATVKYNSSGVQQWATRYNYGPNRYDESNDIVADTLGNVYVVGHSQATGNNSTPPDYITLKYNSSGAQQWATRYNGPLNDEDRAVAVAIDDSLNVYATGYSKGTSTSGVDFATVKYDNAGAQKWVVRYNGTANGFDQSNAIVVWNGSVFVTGKSANNTNDDFFTIRYSYQAVGINEIGNYALHLNLYPNPAPEIVNIQIEGADQNSKLIVEMTDATGRLIKQVQQQDFFQTDGQKIFSINTSGMAKGVYLVAVKSESGEILGQSKLILE
jgi:uncharacterized delta-60 repeat protein